MNPQQEVAEQVLCGYRILRDFALERHMLAELLGVDDDAFPDGISGVASIMIDLLTTLHHYADTRALDWDEIADLANGDHRIEAGVARAWVLPPSALCQWTNWGLSHELAHDGLIVVTPQDFGDVEWIIEQGGSEWPDSSLTWPNHLHGRPDGDRS
jgi:hypothetical protein